VWVQAGRSVRVDSTHLTIRRVGAAEGTVECVRPRVFFAAPFSIAPILALFIATKGHLGAREGGGGGGGVLARARSESRGWAVLRGSRNDAGNEWSR
jgi:hypothetical protein